MCMFEQIMVEHCSPTMAGLKTGNLFTCPCKDKCELNCCIRKLNMLAVPKGVRVIPLKFLKERALVYMYRPEKLKADLDNSEAKSILRDMDYPTENVDKCIVKLAERLKNEQTFPHEIGLFLGYPPEDVTGFIKKGAREAKCVGTWCVFGDEKKAKEKFAAYKKCTSLYKKAYIKNNSIDRLFISGK